MGILTNISAYRKINKYQIHGPIFWHQSLHENEQKSAFVIIKESKKVQNIRYFTACNIQKCQRHEFLSAGL
jgi:hypothetical protein